MASALDNLFESDTDIPEPTAKIIVSHELDSINQSKSWQTLTNIMDSCLDPEKMSQADYAIWQSNLPTLDQRDIILMLSTSGTTSRPKLCPHSSITIATPALAIKDNLGLGPADSLCQHLPTSHIFSVALILTFWVSGGHCHHP
jgi:acyl-CoA synthetase (AMP-forming)/AMP-acid ligase II